MKWEGKQGWGRAAGVRVVMGRAKLGTAGTSGVSGSGRAQLTPVEFMGGLAATSELGQAGPGERVSVAPSPTHRCDFYVWSSNIITLPFPSPCFRNFERAEEGLLMAVSDRHLPPASKSRALRKGLQVAQRRHSGQSF